MTVPPAPRPSITGPAWMTWIGIVLLVATVAIAVGTVGLFLSLLPTGYLASDGGPGDEAIASIEAGETAEVELAAGTSYALLLVRPQEAPADGPSGDLLSGDVLIGGPDGVEAPADRAPAVDMNVAAGGFVAESLAGFRTTGAGVHTVSVPAALDDEPTSVLLVEDREPVGFIGGVFGSIGGVFAVLLLGASGLALTIGGALWWSSRRRARRAFDTA